MAQVLTERVRRLPSLLSRHGPLLGALVALCLVVVLTRKPEPEASAPPVAGPTAAPVLAPSQPLPPEPPFGPLRVADSGLPCDVDQVLASKCRRCHATPSRHGAPFPLYTWAELQVPRSEQPLFVHVGRVVQSGFMPYRIEANPPVEPLADAEKKTLLDWVSAGAPRGVCALDAG